MPALFGVIDEIDTVQLVAGPVFQALHGEVKLGLGHIKRLVPRTFGCLDLDANGSAVQVKAKHVKMRMGIVGEVRVNQLLPTGALQLFKFPQIDVLLAGNAGPAAP